MKQLVHLFLLKKVKLLVLEYTKQVGSIFHGFWLATKPKIVLLSASQACKKKPKVSLFSTV